MRYETPTIFKQAALRVGLTLQAFLEYDPSNAREDLVIVCSTLGHIPLGRIEMTGFERDARDASEAFEAAIVFGQEQRACQGFGTI